MIGRAESDDMMRSMRYPVALLIFFCCSIAHASEFVRLCHSSMEQAPALLVECRQNARPFARDFFPGGRGAPVPENHRAWFSVDSAAPHFGFGCVLGAKEEIRFFGIYYFLNGDNFREANSASFVFVDFNGNVGLQSSGGKMFTLLAVHRLTPPGRKGVLRDRNCELGTFDASSNVTAVKFGDWFSIFKVGFDKPTTIVRCRDREIRYVKSQCTSRKYRSFVNDTTSRVVDGDTIIVTEEGRLFVIDEAFRNFCELGGRPAIERMNFVKELCVDNSMK